MKKIIVFATLSLAALAQAQESEVPPPPAPTSEPVAATATATAGAPGRRDWSVGIAPAIGLVVPTSKLGPFVVGGLEIDFALPVAEKRLVLAIDATITQPSYDGSGSQPQVGGAYSYTIKEAELKLALDLIFRFFTSDHDLVPYLGIGPALQFLKTKDTASFTPGENTEQGTEVGLDLLGGVDYRLGPGMLLGELRFVYSSLDHRFTGDSNAGNLSISLGYRLVF